MASRPLIWGYGEIIQRSLDVLVECMEMLMNASTSVAEVQVVQVMRLVPLVARSQTGGRDVR